MKISGFLRKSALPKCFVFQERARICNNQRNAAKICIWTRFVPLGLSLKRSLRHFLVDQLSGRRSCHNGRFTLDSHSVINNQTAMSELNLINNRQRARSLRSCPHRRVTLIMVGLFTTEAAIKIKRFKRGAHSNGGSTCFSQR